MGLLQSARSRLNLAYWLYQIRRIEDFCFDARRNIRTSGICELEELTLRGDSGDCFMYMPARASNAFQALRELPLTDHSQYTFLDLGSGKGRLLFAAAEHPFRRIEGVEFASELHQVAVENIKAYCCRKQQCSDIQSRHLNVLEYNFPADNLVVCLFNPFGDRIVSELMRRLEESLKKNPRHAIVVFFKPESSQALRTSKGLVLYKETARFSIFQTM